MVAKEEGIQEEVEEEEEQVNVEQADQIEEERVGEVDKDGHAWREEQEQEAGQSLKLVVEEAVAQQRVRHVADEDDHHRHVGEELEQAALVQAYSATNESNHVAARTKKRRKMDRDTEEEREADREAKRTIRKPHIQ